MNAPSLRLCELLFHSRQSPSLACAHVLITFRFEESMALLLQRKHLAMVLVTGAGRWVFLPENSIVCSACLLIQIAGVIVAKLLCKNVSEAVHARQRAWMLLS